MGGPRRTGYAAWFVFGSSPVPSLDFEYDGINHWRLISETDDAPGQLILTWENIPAGDSGFPPDPRRNSYQMIWTHAGDGDADVEVRYARCDWHNELRWNSFYVIVGFHNAVVRGEGDDAELLVRQPDWYHPDSFLPSIKKMCLFSNINERGVYHYTVRDGAIAGCGIAERDYVWDPNATPGDACVDIDNDPGDGCSADCRVEANADGDIFFEPPPDPWLDHAGDIYDPLGAYDQCISRNPAVDCEDLDGDGVLGIDDNCPDTDNPRQYDFDGDGAGDACDPDYDNDSIPNADDICPYAYNYMLHRSFTQSPTREHFRWRHQTDSDKDAYDPQVAHGGGDRCDLDDDNDGILDCGLDGVCLHDQDGVGNIGDFQDIIDLLRGEDFLPDDGIDNDFDGVIDENLEGRRLASPLHDLYNVGGRGDRHPLPDDASEAGSAPVVWAGPDADGSEDNCRTEPNIDQVNTDGDVLGDACDPDIDGDGVTNCGADQLCAYTADFKDNDADGRVDEDGECAAGCPAISDRIDNDLDGFIDEDPIVIGAADLAAASTEVGADVAAWPGPDPDGTEDNCPLHRNADQLDTDGDGLGDACDDDDGDGFFRAAQDPPRPLLVDRQDAGLPADNCPGVANPDQTDNDGTGGGDACDDDDDNDGVPDAEDNCPLTHNEAQADPDQDGLGNACDDDIDGDGVLNVDDNCDFNPDSSNVDSDGDGRGDACDVNDDDDMLSDFDDNCRTVRNDDQADQDMDGIGDDDVDGDGVGNDIDVCPDTPDPEQKNTDGADDGGDACDDDDDDDGRSDADDNCPQVPNNPDFTNTDRADDGGDACDDDDDNDGVVDSEDACPLDPTGSDDTDMDGLGDVCGDLDDDGDGKPDAQDNCPLIPNPEQIDSDGDGDGNACDGDADEDGINDGADNCPSVANQDQADRDGDGEGDVCDADADGDNVPDVDDNCDDVPNPDQADSDFDGIGDACLDKDNDGIIDARDNCPVVDNTDQADQDGDGVGNACDPSYVPGLEQIERCRSETAPLLWAKKCGGEVKTIGCSAVPGQSGSGAWWAVLGLLAMRRRRETTPPVTTDPRQP